MLILTQDRYMVCAKRTIDSEIVLNARDGKLLGDLGHVESRFFTLGGSVCVGARLLHGLC